jgi:hypothetical protein
VAASLTEADGNQIRPVELLIAVIEGLIAVNERLNEVNERLIRLQKWTKNANSFAGKSTDLARPMLIVSNRSRKNFAWIVRRRAGLFLLVLGFSVRGRAVP